METVRRIQRAIAAGCLCLASFTGFAQHAAPSPPTASSFGAALDVGKLTISDYATGSMQHGGRTRTYWYYVPHRQPAGKHAVVFVLHGGSANASNVPLSHEDRWRYLAEVHGLIVVAPEGRMDPNRPQSHYWNDCRNDATGHPPGGIDAEGGVDDVGFIGALIDWAEAQHGVDTNRVYCVGESNGGMMTFRVAEESPHRFAAVAAIIANLSANSECTPREVPIPILVMSATADTTMPFEGGYIVSPSANRGQVLSIPQTVDYWVALNEAAGTPETNELPDVVTSDGSTVTLLTYPGGTNGTEVLFYRINNGGHIVPGPTDPMTTIFGTKNRDIWAADEIWKFFSAHPAADPS